MVVLPIYSYSCEIPVIQVILPRNFSVAECGRRQVLTAMRIFPLSPWELCVSWHKNPFPSKQGILPFFFLQETVRNYLQYVTEAAKQVAVGIKQLPGIPSEM